MEYAIHHEKTKEFMREYLELCQKYNLAVVPTYEYKISFHDTMIITDFNNDTKKFLERTFVNID